MTSLPEAIRIGCFDFSVEDWDPRFASAAGQFGECDKQQNIIRVRMDMPPQRVVEVLLHEINHAVWEVGACEELAEEDRVISAVSNNPDMIAFVSEMLSGEAR